MVFVLLLALLSGTLPRTSAQNTSSDKAALEGAQTDAPGSTPADRPPNNEPFTLASARISMTKEEYLDAFLRSPIEGLLDPLPIRKMCDATKFQPGLVWHCELVNGGIGNVGNMWLNCLRYAVEAGGK